MKKNNSRVKGALFFVLFMMIPGIILAQTKTITGVVKETTGEPIIGVSVFVKGTTTGTITGANGAYSLQVTPKAKTLVFSYIGMKKQEVEITGNVLNVTLESDSRELNELVVVGYGTVRKSDLTGAVSSVNSAKITEKGTTNVISALQGSVPGVQIQQNSSRAGAGFSILVRGQNSISGNTEPLYIVDGITTSSIDFLNPQDIDRIDILKDASSAAIYGSRGANGVVLIQTKSGQSSQQAAKTQISYNGYYGIAQKARMPEFMDSQQFMQFRTTTFNLYTDANNDGVLEIASPSSPTGKGNFANIWCGTQTLNTNGQPFYDNGSFRGSQFMQNRFINNTSTPWGDLVTQDGQQQNHYVDISGSSKDISYVVGFGYQDEKGVFQNEDYNRFNLKGSLTAQLNKHWSAGFNLNSAVSNQELGSVNAVLDAFRMSPIVSPYATNLTSNATTTIIGNYVLIPGKTGEDVKDAAGNVIYPNSIGGASGPTSSYNPLIDLDPANTRNSIRKYMMLGNAYLQFSPIKDLTIKSTFSPNLVVARTGLYESTYSQDRAGSAPLASAGSNYSFSYTWDNQVNYKFKVNQDHSFDVMGLWSVYSGNIEDYTATTVGYAWDYGWYNMGGATNLNGTTAVPVKATSYYKEFSMLSAAARLNYSYKGKYLLTASFRSDGSSKLAPGHQWASFPSVAAGWRVTEESFMSSTKDWLSNLKLRGSIGYTGNNNIDPYQTKALTSSTSTYYNFGTTLAMGTPLGSPASAVLTWERTRELDFGLDFGFLNNRINGSVDIYDRHSTGLLQSVNLAYESGKGAITQNIAELGNKGFEAALNGSIFNEKDFSWTVNASFGTNANKILNLFGHDESTYKVLNGKSQKWFVGQNINSIYGYVFDGVWTAEDIKTAVENKDPRAINSSGIVIAKEGQAKVKDFYTEGNTDGNVKGIDANDRRIQGHTDPTWTGGLGTTIIYKDFDFNMNLYTAQGMTVFSPFMEEFTLLTDRGRQKLNIDYYIPAGTYRLSTTDGSFVATTEAHNSQAYPTPNSIGNYWHTASSDANNDMPGAWVDASYVKVRNMTLGYTLPKKLTKTLNINSFRIYCNVLNPFVFTKYVGFDPEWAGASMGKDNGPSTITYQFGVNLKF